MFTHGEQPDILNMLIVEDIRMNTKYEGERNTLLEALEHVKDALGIEQIQVEWEMQGIRVVDAIVHLEGLQYPYQIMIRKNLRPETVAAIMVQEREFQKPFAVVTNHVTATMAQRLRELGIQFFDTAGNMYIKQDDPKVMVFIFGNKNPGRVTRTKTRLFRFAEMKVLFILLCGRDAIRKPYRELAGMAGVALGTVGNTINDLHEYGYISNLRGRRHLNRRMILLGKWAEAFAEELRPKLNPRRFTTEVKGWWKNNEYAIEDVYLGGETAAAVLTKYLHPEMATIYIGDNFQEFAHKLRLRKDENGNVIVLEKFWNALPDDAAELPTGIAPPLLVYADLLKDGGARNTEVASMIREQYLER